MTRMQDAGVKADVVSYNSLLNTCAKAAGVWGSVGVSQASRIIEMMGHAGVKPDITSFNCLLNAYAQAAGAGHTYQAKEIFEILEYMRAEGIKPDQYSYNTIMNICAKSTKAGARVPAGGGTWGLDEGLQVLRSMSEDGLEADVVTYTALLETCIASLRGTTETVEHCTMILTMMRNAGLQPNAVSYTALITAAKVDGNPKSVVLAEELFYQLPPNQRNGRMYTAMIGALARVGRVQDALKVFEEAKEMIEPDAIMYSAIMTAVAADPRKVKKLHDEMRMRGIQDDDVTRWQLKKAGQVRARSRGSPRPLQDGNMPSKSFVPPWRKARARGTEFGAEPSAEGHGQDGLGSWGPGADIPSAEDDH